MKTKKTKRIWFSITEADIDAGSPGMCKTCPTARAAMRRLGLAVGCVQIMYAGLKRDLVMYIYIGRSNYGSKPLWVGELPDHIDTWVSNFDKQDATDVWPTRFCLDMPIAVLKRIGLKEVA